MCMCGGVVEVGLLMALVAFLRKRWQKCLAAFVLAALALFVAGCTPGQPSSFDIGNRVHVAGELVYLKDVRTGLCFAGKRFYANEALLTAVPCTAEVEKLIVTQGEARP